MNNLFNVGDCLEDTCDQYVILDIQDNYGLLWNTTTGETDWFDDVILIENMTKVRESSVETTTAAINLRIATQDMRRAIS